MSRDYVRRKNPSAPLLFCQQHRVTKNIDLVGKVVRRIRRSSLPRDELYSAGLLGLCLAAKKFDKSTGVPFSSYARVAILGTIIREFRNRPMIHVPAVRPMRFASEWDRARKFRVASLAGPDHNFDPIDPSTAVSSRDASRDRIEAMDRAIERMGDREKAIVARTKQGLSYTDIGRELGLPRHEISKTQRRILSALRHEILSRESQAG